MKEEQDYVRDIAEIRSMMERSSKFLSLSGWAGIMAGVYALLGVFIAWSFLGTFWNPLGIATPGSLMPIHDFQDVILLALLVLVLAVGTAIWLSVNKAKKRNEKAWNPASRHLLSNMAVPLLTGGILILILIEYGLFFFLPSFSLLFYGLALYNAGRFTYKEIRFLGYIQIVLGLLSAKFVTYALFYWALGFGVMHIVYGIYIHNKYEK